MEISVIISWGCLISDSCCHSSGMFEGFLTAMRQEVTRANKGWALDTVTLHNKVLKQTKEEITASPTVSQTIQINISISNSTSTYIHDKLFVIAHCTKHDCLLVLILRKVNNWSLFCHCQSFSTGGSLCLWSLPGRRWLGYEEHLSHRVLTQSAFHTLACHTHVCP